MRAKLIDRTTIFNSKFVIQKKKKKLLLVFNLVSIWDEILVLAASWKVV